MLPFALLAVSAFVVFVALTLGDAVTARDEPTADVQPPLWLRERVTSLVKDVCGDDSVAVVAWKLCDAREYKVALSKALGEDYDMSRPGSGRAVYVVIAHGDFTYSAARGVRPGQPLPTGRTLVVTYDAKTHIGCGLVLLEREVDVEGSMGSMSSLKLL